MEIRVSSISSSVSVNTAAAVSNFLCWLWCNHCQYFCHNCSAFAVPLVDKFFYLLANKGRSCGCSKFMLFSMAYLYFMCMITAGLTISTLVSDIGILAYCQLTWHLLMSVVDINMFCLQDFTRAKWLCYKKLKGSGFFLLSWSKWGISKSKSKVNRFENKMLLLAHNFTIFFYP